MSARRILFEDGWMADDGPHSAAIAYHLCVEDIASRPSRENLCMEPDDLANSPACDFVLRSSGRFRHTVQRAAEHLSPAVAPHALDDHIALGRQRRAQILQSRQKHIDDKRSIVSELAAARAVRVAARLAAKQEAADQRRQASHIARQEQYANAERLRLERMRHAREERVKRMADYSDKVLPLLNEFRAVGLALRGGATKAEEVQRILQQDPRAFCQQCDRVPHEHRCPKTHKVHPRHLVQTAETFLCATSDIRQWIHHDERQQATDESSPAKVPAEADHHEEPLPKVSSNSALAGDGVPQHLPLAFYHATEYSSVGEEAFLARNIVVLLDELFLAAKTLQTAVHSADDLIEEDTAVAAIGSHAAHLRSVVSRFVQSWAKYVKAMHARHAAAPRHSASTLREQLRAQTIRTYLHLAAAQSSRSSDEAGGWTDTASVSESEKATPSHGEQSRRAALVREKRMDLTEAIDTELAKLRREIERMGGVSELEAKLNELGLLDSASSSCGVSSERGRRRTAECTTTTTDGEGEDEFPQDNDPCSSATATPPPERHPTRRAPSGVKSSSKFRAQLAAERERLRRAKRAAEHADPAV